MVKRIQEDYAEFRDIVSGRKRKQSMASARIDALTTAIDSLQREVDALQQTYAQYVQEVDAKLSEPRIIEDDELTQQGDLCATAGMTPTKITHLFGVKGREARRQFPAYEFYTLRKKVEVEPPLVFGPILTPEVMKELFK